MSTLGNMVIASFLSMSRTQNTRGLEHRGMGIRAAGWGAGSRSLTMGVKTPVTLTCLLGSQVSIFEEGRHLFLGQRRSLLVCSPPTLSPGALCSAMVSQFSEKV